MYTEYAVQKLIVRNSGERDWVFCCFPGKLIGPRYETLEDALRGKADMEEAWARPDVHDLATQIPIAFRIVGREGWKVIEE